MAKTTERTFRVKYGNWPVKEAAVAAKVLEGLDNDSIARRVMPAAFAQHKDKFAQAGCADNGAIWSDGKDRKIVLIGTSEGLWEGERLRDDGKKEEWYIMETTEQ